MRHPAVLLSLLFSGLFCHLCQADEYTYSANQEGWGFNSETVFTHVVTLGPVISVDAVSIDLTHSWASDIEFTIEAPNGDLFDLVSDQGDADDLGDGSDDLAGVSTYTFVEAGTPGADPAWGDDPEDDPVAGGTYEALSWHSSGWMAGDWTITLTDDSAGDTGAVGDVTMMFTPVPEPTSGLLIVLGLVCMTRRKTKSGN